MISRGIFIGRIVDDLSSLEFQIQTRNKLGYFDLTKISEDFIKELLNITYNLNLRNLNSKRSNTPGVDLGDDRKKIAIQVTSQKTSAKVNDTLNTITEEQSKVYSQIRIFILGHKQVSYTIEKRLSKKFSFNYIEDIWDINSLLREIVLLEIDKLEMIYNLFLREFRQVKIELEPIDEKGNFESSYYNSVEKKPASPPKNAIRFYGKQDKFYSSTFSVLMDIYDRLASVPRITREILSIIVDKGKFDGAFEILPEALERFMRIDPQELLTEINLLENYNLVHITDGEVSEREVKILVISDELLNQVFKWLIEEKLSVKTLLNTMDFTILDN